MNGTRIPVAPWGSHRWHLGAVLGVLATACSSSKAPTAAIDSGQADTGGSCGAIATGGPVVVGGFLTNFVAATATDPVARTTVFGRVYNGPTLPDLLWTVSAEAGGCQLSTPKAPFCNPSCGGGQVCVENQRCATPPTAQDLGPVRVRGLGSTEFTLTQVKNAYQLPTDLTLSYPPADEGAVVEIVATTGPCGPFTLSSKAVAPLSSSGVVTLQRDAPVLLTWEPAGLPDIARIHVEFDISHHGGIKGRIECDVADTGSLAIAATLITKLIDLGVAGLNSLSVSRVATGSATIPAGIVTSQIISSVDRDVEIAGFTSCHQSPDCAPDATCESPDCPVGKKCQHNYLCEQ